MLEKKGIQEKRSNFSFGKPLSNVNEETERLETFPSATRRVLDCSGWISVTSSKC